MQRRRLGRAHVVSLAVATRAPLHKQRLAIGWRTIGFARTRLQAKSGGKCGKDCSDPARAKPTRAPARGRLGRASSIFIRSAEHFDLDDCARPIDCMRRVELRKDSLREGISLSEFLRAYAGCRIDLCARVVQQRSQNIKQSGYLAQS